MVERKLLNGRLNFDASGYFVPEGDYSDANDIRITPRGLISMEGNRLFSDYYTAPGYWCACSYKDNTRRRVYAILCSEDQKHRFIYCDLDSLSITQMFENITDTNNVDIFGWNTGGAFDPSKAMKGMRIIHKDAGGDMIYFIDPNNVPLKFNDVTFSLSGYGTSPTLEMFKVIKYPPPTPLSAVYDDDATRSVNNLKKKLFQFRYQYVYTDDETSVWSAISKIPLPPKVDDQEYYLSGTKANVIRIVIPTGIKTVKQIKIAARVNIGSVWSDFFLIDTVDKTLLSISDNTNYSYDFFNDGSYNSVDVDESGLLFDYVPDKTNALEIADGRVLVYGGITEGLDKEINTNVTVEITTAGSTLSGGGNMTINDTNLDDVVITISGTPNIGEIFKLTVRSDDSAFAHAPETFNYTVQSGDNSTNVAAGLVALINNSLWVVSTSSGAVIHLYGRPGNFIIGVTGYVDTSAASAGVDDSVSAHKWKGRYKYGFSYYRNDGKTNGVYVPITQELTIDIPAYSEVTGAAQTAVITLNINHAPPSWADYYHIVRTKELTALKSIFWVTSGCGENGGYSYLNISNFTTHAADFPTTAATLNYSFSEGDRVRIIRRMTATPTVLDNYDFEILGVVTDPPTLAAGKYIKIKKTTSTSTYGLDIATNLFYIEIYSPAPILKENLNVFYEIGEKYSIYIDSNGNRSHIGKSQNQIQGTGSAAAIIKITDGDYYLRSRKLTVGATGTFQSYFAMDVNFSDGYLSAVHNEGRALVIDDTIKEQFYPGLIRFGLPYLSGSSTNNLSRFYPANQKECNATYGAILNMKSRENFIRVFQRYKISMMPVYRQMIYDASGTQTVGLSSQVLSNPDYYVGDFGIDKYGLSLVSTDFGDYFLDDINNALVRVSNDGITNISDTYNAKIWSNANILANYSGFGGFHYEDRLVFMAIVDDNGDVQNVISFSEYDKGFNSKHSFTNAENILFIDGFLWTFKGGLPWVHDRYNCNYYNVQYNPNVTVTFNKGIDFKKNYVSVGTVSNRKWGCPEILTSSGQNSELWIDDFRMREDGYHAALLRDMASPKGLLRGDPLKGNWISVKFQAGYSEAPLDDILVNPTPTERDTSTDSVLTLVSVTYNESNLNKR